MNVLGLLVMLIFIAGVIAFAAGMTWLVVKYTPAKRANQTR